MHQLIKTWSIIEMLSHQLHANYGSEGSAFLWQFAWYWLLESTIDGETILK